MPGTSTKWLNIRDLCRSYLHQFGKDATLEKIYYFSALAEHLEATKPDVTLRHRLFIQCLLETGILVNLNRFKKKQLTCHYCHRTIIRHEEKETDVTMALMTIRLFSTNECDTLVLVTGDTDLSPAAKFVKEMFPQKKIIFAFPYKRKNEELKKLCPGSFNIGRHKCPVKI